jgi:uncharacterized protein YjeT (DUF2065 family)
LDSQTFWLALGLALILEGLFPFLSPAAWRRVVSQIQQLQDGQVRFFGLCSILAGVLLMLFLL